MLAVLPALLLLLIVLVASSAASAAGLQARTWGINTNGELGIGTDTGPETCLFGEPCSTRPVTPASLGAVTSVAAGAFHGLAVTETGTVLAWGFNGSGQLGVSSPTESPTPLTVAGLSGVIAVAAGHEFSLALLADGTVEAWGEDNFGQLGNGTHNPSSTPEPVSGLSGVTAIAAGADHAVALLGNGTVMSWGAGSAGQLGNGASTGSSVPVAVKSLSTVTAISAGQNHTLARLASGKLVAWGENAKGQLGNNRTANSNVPVNVSGISTATAVAAGGAHSLALLANGTVEAWGENAQGELGNGGTANSSVPVAVSGLSGVTGIAAGYFHSLALAAKGQVWSWGYNGNGQLGSGGTVDSDVPGTVPGLAGIKALAANQYDTIAIGTNPPTVTAISPESGSSNGNTTVTVTGTHLDEAERVLFGVVPAKSFTVKSPTSLTAVSPAGSGTVDLTVEAASGTSPVGGADRFKYLATGPPPVVTGISPAEGPAAGGTSVTISGSQFTGASEVLFGGTPAGFTLESAGSIKAVSPAGSGTVDVTVVTGGGGSETSSADRFAYIPPGPSPTVAKVKPGKGPAAGGTKVTITGTNFTGVTAIDFAGAPAASFEVLSATKLTAVSPPGPSGPADVTVTNVNGTSGPAAKGFKYGAPSVASVSPASGPKGGGATVTVTGAGFAPGTSTVFLFGGGHASAVECTSTNACTMISPAGRGPVDVRAVQHKMTSPRNPPGDTYTFE